MHEVSKKGCGGAQLLAGIAQVLEVGARLSGVDEQLPEAIAQIFDVDARHLESVALLADVDAQLSFKLALRNGVRLTNTIATLFLFQSIQKPL